MIDQIWVSLAIFFLLGAVTGLLSGTLGVGGGIVMVPGLAWIFSLNHFSSASIMQLAAGTSLAVMVVSMFRALLAHRRYKVEFWSVYRRWIFPVIVGVFWGVVLAHFLHSRVLAAIFGFFMILVSLKMFLPLSSNQDRKLPGTTLMSITGLIVGTVSSMLGIGGGVLIIPFLVHHNVEMRRALVTSIAVSFTIAICATILVIFTGMHQPGLPGETIGYIYWPAWIGLAIGSFIFVPFGAALSHRLPVTVLRHSFAVIMLLIAIHLLIRVFH